MIEGWMKGVRCVNFNGRYYKLWVFLCVLEVSNVWQTLKCLYVQTVGLFQ